MTHFVLSFVFFTLIWLYRLGSFPCSICPVVQPCSATWWCGAGNRVWQPSLTWPWLSQYCTTYKLIILALYHIQADYSCTAPHTSWLSLHWTTYKLRHLPIMPLVPVYPYSVPGYPWPVPGCPGFVHAYPESVLECPWFILSNVLSAIY